MVGFHVGLVGDDGAVRGVVELHIEGNCITAHREHHSKKEGLKDKIAKISQIFIIRYLI